MKTLLGLLLSLFVLSAQAQTVTQSGNVTPGQPARWVTNGVIGSGGTPTNPLLTGVGVLASGPAICSQSGTSNYNRICIGATSTAGIISLDNIGSATGGFTLRLNGVTQGFPTVTLPVTVGDFACFASTTGTLQDCGFPSNPIPGTSVSFLQAGAGAILRNIQAARQDIKTVKDFGVIGYAPVAGACGSGAAAATDDTAALTIAANKPFPSYLVDDTCYKITSRIVMTTDGGGLLGNRSSIIYMPAASFNNTTVPFSTGRYGANAIGFYVHGLLASPWTPLKNVVLKGFTIESEVAGGRAVDAVGGGNATNLRVEGLEIKGFPVGVGLRFSSVLGGWFLSNYIHDFTTNFAWAAQPQISAIEIDNDRINSINSDVIFIEGNHGQDLYFGAATLFVYPEQNTDCYNVQGDLAKNVVINGNICKNAGEGVDSFALGVVISNNVLIDNSVYGVKLINGAYKNNVIGNTIIRPGIAGIGVFGAVSTNGAHTITGNAIYDVDPLAAHALGDTAGIIISGAGAASEPVNVSMQGNYIDCGSSATVGANGKYGILTYNSGTGHKVGPNTIIPSKCTVADYSLNATSTARLPPTAYGFDDYPYQVMFSGTDSGGYIESMRLANKGTATSSSVGLSLRPTNTNSRTVDFVGTYLGSNRFRGGLTSSNAAPAAARIEWDDAAVALLAPLIPIGGRTSSQVALAQSGTRLTVRLGDNTGDADLTAGSLTLATIPLALNEGGTNARLVASNGGVIYSTASAMAVLAGTASASRPLLSGASTTPSWAAVSYPASATSGGIPYFSSTSAMASSALLTANGVVYGGGAGTAPASTAAGTNGQLFLGVTSGAPAWGTMSQDCTITNAGVVTCLRSNNTLFGTAAFQNTGTSGANIPFLSGTNSWSGVNTFTSKIVAGSTSDVRGVGTFFGAAFDGNIGTISVQSSASMAADNGGCVTMEGYSETGTSGMSPFAAVCGKKENGTSGNSDGYIEFRTRSGNVNYVGKIGSTGNLTVTGSATAVLANTATTSAICYNTGTGLFTYNGTVGTCTVSDGALKDVESPITGALARLLQINGVYYNWKDAAQGTGRQVGVIAQDVEKVFPELVSTDSAGVKSADYQKLVAPIIEAMRELKVENDNLRACNDNWKCRLFGIR